MSFVTEHTSSEGHCTHNTVKYFLFLCSSVCLYLLEAITTTIICGLQRFLCFSVSSMKSHDLEPLRKKSPHGATIPLAWPALVTTMPWPCMKCVRVMPLYSKHPKPHISPPQMTQGSATGCPMSVPGCHAHFAPAYNCANYPMGMWRSKAPGGVLALP